MMREWATVVAWQGGMATLRTESKVSCHGCSVRKGCGGTPLNKSGPREAHVVQIVSAQPLQPGQRVELGIQESSLLSSALLVYMVPLVGLLLGAGLCQAEWHSDLAAAAGALCGGLGGFCVTQWISARLGTRDTFQPVILNVALPVTVVPVNSE